MNSLKSNQMASPQHAQDGRIASQVACDSVISIRGVSKRFGRKVALDSVDLEIRPGLVFALLGENGAGKSTLIRGLLGFHRFDAGSVSVLGIDPSKNPLELRHAVGYVSDAPGMYEWMTVAEAGWFAAGYYPQGFIARFEQMTREFELPLHTKILKLSKGMRAKLALSLALAHNPELLILDEPTSGLDPAVRRSFLESMVDRAAAGQTVFLSSHQIHEVERVADWVAILHQGKVQIAAPLEELKSNLTILCFAQRDPLLALPASLADLDVLASTHSGRAGQWLVRGLDVSLVDSLSSDPNLIDVKAYRPNLEELYLAFTQYCAVADQSFDSPALPRAV